MRLRRIPVRGSADDWDSPEAGSDFACSTRDSGLYSDFADARVEAAQV